MAEETKTSSDERLGQVFKSIESALSAQTEVLNKISSFVEEQTESDRERVEAEKEAMEDESRTSIFSRLFRSPLERSSDDDTPAARGVFNSDSSGEGFNLSKLIPLAMLAPLVAMFAGSFVDGFMEGLGDTTFTEAIGNLFKSEFGTEAALTALFGRKGFIGSVIGNTVGAAITNAIEGIGFELTDAQENMIEGTLSSIATLMLLTGSRRLLAGIASAGVAAVTTAATAGATATGAATLGSRLVSAGRAVASRLGPAAAAVYVGSEFVNLYLRGPATTEETTRLREEGNFENPASEFSPEAIASMGLDIEPQEVETPEERTQRLVRQGDFENPASEFSPEAMASMGLEAVTQPQPISITPPAPVVSPALEPTFSPNATVASEIINNAFPQGYFSRYDEQEINNEILGGLSQLGFNIPQDQLEAIARNASREFYLRDTMDGMNTRSDRALIDRINRMSTGNTITGGSAIVAPVTVSSGGTVNAPSSVTTNVTHVHTNTLDRPHYMLPY